MSDDAGFAGPRTEDGPERAPGAPRIRPQALMLNFLGNLVLDRGVCVFSGSYIDVFARVGVSEHATRSTLSRMSRRGLLRKQRSGRRVYFGVTPRSAAILRDGERRIWSGVLRDGDAGWTLLAFSMPESWQRERHDLRSKLTWSGFGPLQNGLWIAPSRVDVDALLADTGLESHVRVFYARPSASTDMHEAVRDAFDLDGLAAGYRTFLDTWDVARPYPDAPDDLARELLLLTEWLQIIRRDPRLPVDHLPPDWPAVRAETVFRELHRRYQTPARAIAEEILDTIPLACPDTPAQQNRGVRKPRPVGSE